MSLIFLLKIIFYDREALRDFKNKLTTPQLRVRPRYNFMIKKEKGGKKKKKEPD